MKLQHLIPILFLAAFCTVSAQTNNALADTNTPSFDSDTNEQYWISPAPIRVYHVSGEKFIPHLKQLVTPKTGESDQDLLLRYFKEQHIKMQKPAMVYLILDADILVVHAPGADQAKIESLLSKTFNDD